MKTITKPERQEFYWTLKKITGGWIYNGMLLKKEARESKMGTEV